MAVEVGQRTHFVVACECGEMMTGTWVEREPPPHWPVAGYVLGVEFTCESCGQTSDRSSLHVGPFKGTRDPAAVSPP